MARISACSLDDSKRISGVVQQLSTVQRLNYELLKKGVCAFNNGDRDPSECVCEKGFPIPLPQSSSKDSERAYFDAVQENYYLPGSRERWKDADSLLRFLLAYGMARVMPPKEQRRKMLVESVSIVRPHLSKLEKLDLMHADLEDVKLRQIAKTIYRSINSGMRTKRIQHNATVVGKILHILQPRLFVIWDDKIREPRGFGRSFDEYWKYLRTAQSGLSEALEDYRKMSSDMRATSKTIERALYENGWKPLSKLYDEACYAMVRGWNHFS